MKILIAEDEKSNIEEIERIIAGLNQDIEVFAYLNPFDALYSANSNIYDLALLDIQMPEMNGLTLAENISAIQPSLPVVFISAYNNYATEAFELKAADYILKPIRSERLVKIISGIKYAEKRSIPAIEYSKKMIIRSFGGLRIFNEIGEIYWDRPKTRELFALLLMNKGKRVNKELICDELWPKLDSTRALANLQVTVCRLRKTIGVFSREMVTVKYVNNYYCLTLGDVSYDADQFDLQCNSNEEIELNRANQLYGGSFFGPDGWLWSEPARADYFKKYIRLTKALADHYLRKGMTERAESVLRQAVVSHEPDDNLSKLLLLISYMLDGSKGLLNTFRLLSVRYDDELGIKVPREVVQEYERLRK